ncbi:MAG: ribosome assembly RNA-binding protein YhbY [Deltaproteobacteria bacterium]|nr:ribosome assembly RNA-binding protein YhbY [Deltaproteobacteria bacterium]
MTPSTPLTGKQRRHLRALAHHLEPVVLLGKLGVTDGVVDATRSALETHELVKVKLGKECPSTLDEVSDALAAGTGAHIVGSIGKTLLVYLRHRSEPKINLPRA